MPPRGKEVDTWRWIPGGEPCAACAALEGDHDQCPGPPHPNCHCQCVHIERQINPRGKKQPYQVGIQLKAYGARGAPDRYLVSVTCMRPERAGDNGDEEYDAENGGNGDDEWETGETHAGEIDVPSGTGPGMNEAAEEMLYDYAKGLYENYCIGYV